MSLNRYEQAVFDYLEAQVDERAEPPGVLTRELERELWDYFVERSPHVPRWRDLNLVGLRRVSFLNLAEHLFHRWGPPPKLKKLLEGSRG
jgi:hypothetical protein